LGGVNIEKQKREGRCSRLALKTSTPRTADNNCVTFSPSNPFSYLVERRHKKYLWFIGFGLNAFSSPEIWAQTEKRGLLWFLLTSRLQKVTALL
jgi:hypothetical protein